MKTLTLALVALLIATQAHAHGNAVPQSPTPGNGEAVAEAAATVDAFHDALAKGDPGAAAALLDDQVQIYEQGWVERSKTEYAAHHLASDMAFAAATASKRTSRSGSIIGDLAYVASEAAVTGTFKDKAVDSIVLETMVLRRSPDGWRIVHIHWSSRSAKK